MSVGLEWGQGCVSKISYTKKVLKHFEVTLVDTLETPEYCDVIKVLL